MMIEKSAGFELLELEKLRQVLRTPGPCITVLLPPYHPGEPAESAATRLKGDLQEAVRVLTEQGFSKDATRNFLEPLEQLDKDPSSKAGSRWGRAIFRSPDVFAQFHLEQPVKPSLTVAGCFAIRQLLPELWIPRVFYLLGISKKSLELLRCTPEGAEPVALPKGMPASIEDALELEPPDHDLENRSAAGSSTGAMHALRFGTGGGREKEDAYRAHFFKLVDHGLKAVLHGQVPLILAGVEEDIAAYRALSTYRGLVKKSLHGNPMLLLKEAGAIASAAAFLRDEELEREEKALEDSRERVAANRLSTSAQDIVRAAFDGRVYELFLAENAEAIEICETPGYTAWGKEDLFNLAAVQTTIHGGKAFELPKGAGAVGIMRY
ncbi:MAG TPA: hypothetical protein VK752_00635 [Bryobacteraceae bacterium]|jgi:hypothetical protein|nr:hypothetical protein [Bryobacteraceae bacterium]